MYGAILNALTKFYKYYFPYVTNKRITFRYRYLYQQAKLYFTHHSEDCNALSGNGSSLWLGVNIHSKLNFITLWVLAKITLRTCCIFPGFNYFRAVTIGRVSFLITCHRIDYTEKRQIRPTTNYKTKKPLYPTCIVIFSITIAITLLLVCFLYAHSS